MIERRAPAPSVLVIGDVMDDVIVRPEGPLVSGADRRATIRELPGGSGANQAAWLAAFGVRTAFAGRVGADAQARHARVLESCGVEPHLGADDTCPTGRVVALIAPDGERSFFTDRGANDGLCRADLPNSLLAEVGLVHVSGYSLFGEGPRAAVLDFLAEARRRNVPFTVDPASHSFLRDADPKKFLRWTSGAAICFPNEVEAAVLAGTDDPEAQLAALGSAYPLAVVKRGRAGAAAAAGQERWSVEAPQVEMVDASGAGDAFLAGFLAAWLAQEEIAVCLARAVEAGSRACTFRGARPPSAPLSPSFTDL